METGTTIDNQSNAPPRPSLINAGFVALEVFDIEREAMVSSSLTKLLGTPPESKPSNFQIFWPPRPLAKSTTWRPDTQKLAGILSEDAKRFNVDIDDYLPYCRSVSFSLVTPPAVPFIILLVHVSLDPTRLGPTDARDKLGSIAIPFRVFLERLMGLSAQGSMWSPRVASITWASVKVEQSVLDQTAASIASLSKLRERGPTTREEEKIAITSILKDQPLSLGDPAFPISSYVMPAGNVHVIIGQSSQPGFGQLRTPCIVWLTPDDSLLALSEDIWMTQYLASIGFSDLLLPIWFEGMLTWLISLNIWAHEREIRAFGLDQQVAGMLHLPTKSAATEDIEDTLSSVSQMGTTVAIEERKVKSVLRWSSNALKRIIEDTTFKHEIPLSSMGSYLPRNEIYYRQIVGLAKITNQSLQNAAGSFRDIETEITKFQTHVSDLATLRARDASGKLNRRLESISKVLVVLTAVLVVLTAVLAAKAVLGK